MNIVAPLRILYIALAIVFGLGLTAAGVLGVWDFLQSESAGGSDAPPPFGLSSYCYTPFIAASVLLSAFAALKRRWQMLALICWFLLGGAVLDALYVGWLLVRHGVIPESVDAAFAILWALFPMLGLLLSANAPLHQNPNPEVSPSASLQERMRLRNTLLGMAAVSYLWRVIVVVFNPGMTFAIAYLRGLTDLYGPEFVTLSGAVGLGIAIALVVCVTASSRGGDRITHVVLAFAVGFAFEGFLDTLDYAFWLGSPRELTYSLQDAVAFVACCAALALTAWDPSARSRSARSENGRQFK